MKKLILMPLWILQIFTQTKSFKKNLLLGNRWLNRMGLHVLRLILAHSVMRWRMFLLSGGIRAEHKQMFFRDGYILITDFLDQDQAMRLRSEIQNADGEVRECIQGDTLTHRIMLDRETLDKLPECRTALDHPYLLKLLKFASGKNRPPVSFIQTIKNHYVNGDPDPQKNLHSDTFHPTMKSWYFIDDVDETNGPFTYVPGSHRLTLARLKWEYHKSIQISEGADRYSANGSLRLTGEDAAAMSLAPAQSLKVPANTLVIANTHGFHCRGEASERSTRSELWTISRTSPFNPFPGIDTPWFNDLQVRALDAWRRYEDRKAGQRGNMSSWHVVKARNTIAGEGEQG
ncbi:MAG: phytanoyl-CoA dioxygenase family protein [Gammaproteobacteria bacterium]|nr:phytanoyl-CoA dioxygenase family protein [Gammaproteobacteria bacterium]